jgi:membrane-bound lytic murein transglycosylase A
MLKTKIGPWFQPKKVLSYICAVFITLYISGCHRESAVTDSGDVMLKKVQFADLAGWNNDNFAEVISVFNKNCNQIMKKSGVYLGNSAIKVKISDLQNKCNKFFAANIKNSNDMKKFLESEFNVYAVTDKGKAEGKFTSYYEAVIHASYHKSDKYKYPVYGKPNDLIEINLRDFGTDLPDKRLVGRVDNNKFVPYYNRRDIENKGISAPVLVWGDDLVDIHFMQIQGSAVAKMDDGTEVRIGYADNNGYKFKGIGSILISKGYISKEDSSMPKIREWLRKNPDKAQDLMAENERFIFQKINTADGPLGAFGIPLTAGRSLAVDTDFIPLGSVLWLNTTSPDHREINKVVFAQDIGSAIKGVVRGDYFWGHGEEALKHAGRMNSSGKYFIILPKEAAVKAY